MAGNLRVEPHSVTAGESARVLVENAGDIPLLYGLGNTRERMEDGGWVEVPGADAGPVPAVALAAQPGKTGSRRPRDEIHVPEGLEAGVYRVSKRVSGSPKLGPPRLTLHAPLRVLASSP